MAPRGCSATVSLQSVPLSKARARREERNPIERRPVSATIAGAEFKLQSGRLLALSCSPSSVGVGRSRCPLGSDGARFWIEASRALGACATLGAPRRALQHSRDEGLERLAGGDSGTRLPMGSDPSLGRTPRQDRNCSACTLSRWHSPKTEDD